MACLDKPRRPALPGRARFLLASAMQSGSRGRDPSAGSFSALPTSTYGQFWSARSNAVNGKTSCSGRDPAGDGDGRPSCGRPAGRLADSRHRERRHHRGPCRGLHWVWTRSSVKRDIWSERHLLRPFDILVTARSQSVKVALIPPAVSRTVASSTLLVVRAPDPGSGMAHFLSYYLTSTRGRAEVAARLTATSLPALSAKALGDVRVMAPPATELRRLADLIETAAVARAAAFEAVRVRHDVLRDAIIAAIAAPATGRN